MPAKQERSTGEPKTPREFFNPLEFPEGLVLDPEKDPRITEVIKRLFDQPPVTGMARIDYNNGRRIREIRKSGLRATYEPYYFEPTRGAMQISDGKEWKNNVWYDAKHDLPLAFYASRADSPLGVRLITLHYEGAYLETVQEFDITSPNSVIRDDVISNTIEYTISYGLTGRDITSISLHKTEPDIFGPDGIHVLRAKYALSAAGDISGVELG